jgi:hypothetical protein
MKSNTVTVSSESNLEPTLGSRRARRIIHKPSRFQDNTDMNLEEASLEELTIMFSKSLSQCEESLLLLDSSQSKPPQFIVHHEDSKDLKDPLSLEEAMASKYWPCWLV